MLTTLLQLAQTPTGGASQQSPMAAVLPFALILGMVVFMVLTSRSQKKREKRERESMHDRMAKNDRVLTIGGVIGTVHAIKENEVVLKVDESTNTKMTFTKTAIQKIIED